MRVHSIVKLLFYTLVYEYDIAIVGFRENA